MEIIVVDNHSDDDSVGVLRNCIGDLPNVRIVETPSNDGFGYGYNTGARYARGKYILFNNPAKLLSEDGIEKLVRKMDSDESIGILAPKLMHGDGTQRSSARSFPDVFDLIIKRTPLRYLFAGKLSHYLQMDFNPDVEREVEWVIGGSFMIRRSLFEQLKGYDERFFLFFEDTDLCKRISQTGKRVVYFPEVSALDRKRRLSEMSLFKLPFTRIGRAHIRSAIQYFWKWRRIST